MANKSSLTLPTRLILSVSITVSICLLASVSCLEDDIQFLMKWPGSLLDTDTSTLETLDIVTDYNEKYKCTMPLSMLEAEKEEEESKKNLNENSIKTSSLINENIHEKKLCSYRIESFWIYELCHGQYLKQYHETKASGKRIITDEYFLGYYDATKQEPDYFKQSENKLMPNIHWRTFEGNSVPMFAVKYTGGTLCDVIGNVPRETTIFYACDETGSENIAFFEEVSSCVYEMIVITKWLCSHPAYKIPEKTHQTISCYAVENTPPKPTELIALEKELVDSKNQDVKVKMTDNAGQTFIIHYKNVDGPVYDEGNQQQQDVSNQLPIDQNKPNEAAPQETPPPTHDAIKDEVQKDMINSFVSGHQCLNGGTGWWKYEVCYKKHVLQYHEDEKTRKRQNIMLGLWNNENHLEWLVKNPNKRPLPNKNERVSSSLFFSNGDVCHELNNRRRFVEVKLRCLRNKDKHAISLYLIEPSLCEYMLVIESHWLCEHIESLDSNGFPAVTVDYEQLDGAEASKDTTTAKPTDDKK